MTTAVLFKYISTIKSKNAFYMHKVATILFNN
jgi:hypothetical protein